MNVKRLLVLAVLWIGCLAAQAVRSECTNLSAHWMSMREGRVELRSINDEAITLPVRIAETAIQRRSGFQDVCPELMRTWSILFLFERNVTAEFHMRRVAEALDIAFVGADGRILDVQSMQPVSATGGSRRYTTKGSFRYALETSAGRLRKIALRPGDWRITRLSKSAP